MRGNKYTSVCLPYINLHGKECRVDGIERVIHVSLYGNYGNKTKDNPKNCRSKFRYRLGPIDRSRMFQKHRVAGDEVLQRCCLRSLEQKPL